MWNQINYLWILIQRDFAIFLADRRAALLTFMVPIILASTFGLIFDNPCQQLGNPKLSLWIVDEDHQPMTETIVADLLKNENVIAEQIERTEGERRIEKGSPGVMIVFLPGFSEISSSQFKPLEKPRKSTSRVLIHHHPLSSMESKWAEGIVTEVVIKRFGETCLKPLYTERPDLLERPFDVERVSNMFGSKQKFHPYSHCFGGMIVQYLLFWGMESGLLFLRERRSGIWNRLRSLPVPMATILLGRLLSTAVLAFAQISITFVFGWLVFGVAVQGSLIGFLFLILGMSLLSATTGLLIATLGGTEARARNFCILVILGISLLGGLWLPGFLLPKWIQLFSSLLPTSWTMHAWDALTWQQADWTTIFYDLMAIYAFSGLFLLIASVRFFCLERNSRQGWKT